MYLVLLTGFGVASALLAANAWRNRRYPGFVYFAAMEAATAIWVLCYLGESLDPANARLWFAAKFPAIATIAPSWLLFVLHQVGKRPRRRAWWLLYLWPLVVAPIAFTNDLHHLFFTEVVTRKELVGVNGPIFTLHLAGIYTLLCVSAALLVNDWRRHRGGQSLLLVAGAVLPFTGNVLNQMAKTSPEVAALVPLNPTLPSFALSAVFIGWATMRYRLRDPRPTARDLLFESMADAVLVLNQRDVIVDANRAAAEMLGIPESELLGLPWSRVFGTTDWRDIPDAAHHTVERTWTRGSTLRWLEVQRQPLTNIQAGLVGLLVVVRDITTRKSLEQELRLQGYRDRLTGLSNRRYLEDESARLQRGREFPIAIFAFDLDGLKQVNDENGHEAGDELLQATAAFLQHFFRAGDRVIRLGGDEFLVLLPATRADEADGVLARLQPALEEFNIGRAVPVRFSTGVSVVAVPEAWAAGLKQADARLYAAKRAARARPL